MVRSSRRSYPATKCVPKAVVKGFNPGQKKTISKRHTKKVRAAGKSIVRKGGD